MSYDLKKEIEFLHISVMEARIQLSELQKVVFELAQKVVSLGEVENMITKNRLNFYTRMLESIERVLPGFPDSEAFRDAYLDYKQMIEKSDS